MLDSLLTLLFILTYYFVVVVLCCSSFIIILILFFFIHSLFDFSSHLFLVGLADADFIRIQRVRRKGPAKKNKKESRELLLNASLNVRYKEYRYFTGQSGKKISINVYRFYWRCIQCNNQVLNEFGKKKYLFYWHVITKKVCSALLQLHYKVFKIPLYHNFTWK